MKTKELIEALRLITKALNDPRMGPDRGDQLRKAKRELEAVARSGRPEGHRVFRAVEMIATVLLQTLDTDSTQK